MGNPLIPTFLYFSIMKKLFFLFFILTVLTNESYASFPVDTLNKVAQENIISEDPEDFFDKFDRPATLSLILVAITLFLFFSAGFLLPDLSSLGVGLILILLFTVASILAIIGLFSRERWWHALIALLGMILFFVYVSYFA